MNKLEINVVDICLPCYVTSANNIAIPLDNSTTYQDVKDAVIDELNSLEYIGDNENNLSDDVIQSAVNDLFSTVIDMSKPFDNTLDDTNDMDENVYLYLSAKLTA